ncbi:DNA packaging enzyme (terminase) [Salinivibrio phage CW02]|uniref:DNA packaging enzyme (Terminase) n=1 Tax=Salinivibrio phage CW02 TaxID=1161935 RepID=H9D1H6_9CAUD|nr:DNA packaging enzyme (terminase) [Salinivibrio phage CW02]AFE86218.1 DNA packaging enzyme (terminase) [Salinivibrio phage CW02]
MEKWLQDAYKKIERMPDEAKEIRERALGDLFFFARLVNPGYVYGQIHKDLFRWMQDYTLFGKGGDLTANKLIMLPRAHLKSHMVATWCAWIVARHPEVTMLYVSATAELAITQLYAIQNILGSSKFQRYFPEYINPQEGLREKWSSTKITVDHPQRRKEGIRDATIATAGLTTNTTGWHADVIVADDLVVPENAYTEEGRESVSKKASQFTSIRNAGGFTMACGTRYHPSDIYAVWKEQTYEVYDDEGLLTDVRPVWEIKEHAVETDGIFLWPRTVRNDGKAFGFDKGALARIKAEYTDRVQFYAQYYNDPNDPGSNRISRDTFQYYNPRFLLNEGGVWKYNGKRLNIYAAVDFAFSLSKKADYTAIVVIGVDCDGNVYVLDIDRFKTDRVAEYFKHVRSLHSKWGFKKLRAEVTAAQEIIVNDIKDYVRKEGLSLSVDKYRPNRHEGSKEERIAATLEHRYEDYLMWHHEGGWTEVLEEELIMARPAHDDIKDALASAVSIAIKPKQRRNREVDDMLGSSLKIKTHSRFGGVAY